MTPFSIFIACSAQQTFICDDLYKHLIPLMASRAIQVQHEVEAGQPILTETERLIQRADLILLLICPDIFAYEHLDLVLQEPEKVVPILIFPCRWQTHPGLALLKNRVLPDVNWPIHSAHWFNADQAWYTVVREIERLVMNSDQRAFPRRLASRAARPVAMLLALLLTWWLNAPNPEDQYVGSRLACKPSAERPEDRKSPEQVAKRMTKVLSLRSAPPAPDTLPDSAQAEGFIAVESGVETLKNNDSRTQQAASSNRPRGNTSSYEEETLPPSLENDRQGGPSAPDTLSTDKDQPPSFELPEMEYWQKWRIK